MLKRLWIWQSQFRIPKLLFVEKEVLAKVTHLDQDELNFEDEESGQISEEVVGNEKEEFEEIEEMQDHPQTP